MKKLGSLNKAAAWLIAAAMALIAVFGIGGLKLSSKYHSAEKNFYRACSSANGTGFDADYEEALGFAASMLPEAEQVLGKDNFRVKELAAALADAKAAKGDPAKAMEAKEKLYPLVTNVYSAAQNKKEGADSETLNVIENIDDARDDFTSACDRIDNSYSKAYNEYKSAINDLKGGFPTSAIKALWGIGND